MSKSPIQVLLMEDNPTDVKLVEYALSKYEDKVTFTSYSSIKELRDTLDLKSFDLVITDLNLSDSNGIETIRKVNEICRGCPIVVLTGSDDTEMIQNCINAGAYTFLHKGEVNGNLRRAIISAKAIKDRQEKLLEVVKSSFSGREGNK